jgi:hypothetical protein
MPLIQTDMPIYYLHLASGRWPLSKKDIISENPQTSYPASFPVPDGYALVFPAPAPTVDPITQIAREIAPVLTQLGTYQQAYEVVELDAETVAANRATTQTAKWGAIKQTRDLRKTGGVNVDGKWFHSDAESRIQQLGLVMMGANVPSVQWKTMDGTFVTMSQTLATQIFQAVATLDMTLFSAAEAHRAGMEASARPDQYDFSAGWPEYYGEGSHV